MLRSLLIATVVIGIYGCAGLPETRDLAETPQSNQTFTLSEGIKYRPTGRKEEIGLLPGRYYLEKENSVGQFFVGESRAVWWTLHRFYRATPEYAVTQGGIWIPRDRSRKPMVYYYPDGGLTRDTFEEAIAARGEGMSSVNEKGEAGRESTTRMKQAVEALGPEGGVVPRTGAGLVASAVAIVITSAVGRVPLLYMDLPDAEFTKAIWSASTR